jgi:hypothetical protein
MAERCRIQAFHVGHIPTGNFRPIFEEPVHSLLKSWETVYKGGFKGKSRVKRNEPNEAANRQLHAMIAPLNRVVVHSVLLVPQAEVIFATMVCHGIRDEDEVLWQHERSSFSNGVGTQPTSKNFDAISSYTGLCLANSRAMLNLRHD